MFTYGLLPNILLPTRVQGESATIIDNIFTNNIHIGPFYAGPYWRYFWFAALIRAGVKRGGVEKGGVVWAKNFLKIIQRVVKLNYRLMTFCAKYK